MISSINHIRLMMWFN